MISPLQDLKQDLEHAGPERIRMWLGALKQKRASTWEGLREAQRQAAQLWESRAQYSGTYTSTSNPFQYVNVPMPSPDADYYSRATLTTTST